MDSSDEGNTSTLYAIAKHAFRGKNNDEVKIQQLSFDVGDMIAITKREEGGWWEGTFNGDTGWFPSNYAMLTTDKDKLLRSRSVPSTSAMSPTVNGVKEIEQRHLHNVSRKEIGRRKQHMLGGGDSSLNGGTTTKKFITLVLDDFVSSEHSYILTLKKLVEEYLDPLSKSDLLSSSEFSTVEGGIVDIYALQAAVFAQIQDISKMEVNHLRLGGTLMACAPDLKDLLHAYCANHPDAVDIISRKSDALSALFSSRHGDVKTFILGLSEPFRHLAKYPTSLQELYRNMPDAHADRGDVHRACAVYRNLKVTIFLEIYRGKCEMALLWCPIFRRSARMYDDREKYNWNFLPHPPCDHS